MKKRDIKINKNLESFVQDLYSNKKVFSTLYELLIFAALIGYRKKNYETFQKSVSDPIKFHIFENNHLEDFILTLALSKYKQDITIFQTGSEVDICQPFEFYASGGLTEIKAWIATYGNAAEPQKAIMIALINEKIIPKDFEGVSVDDILKGISF